MWTELRGTVKRFVGTNGTPSLPKGASIIQIVAFGAGTVQMPDGAGGSVTFTIPAAGWYYRPQHLSTRTITGSDVVFGSTTSYFVEIFSPHGA